MASTYTTNVGIEKLEVGGESGTWGGKTNINFDLIDEALNGIISVTLGTIGTSGAPNALPITEGASSNGRNAFIELIDGGDLGGTAFVQLTPNDAEKIVYIRNSLSASRSVNIFQGTYNASNDYTLAAGKDSILKFNGGGAGATVTTVLNDLDIAALTAATADINGGTVDAVVGGTTPAAGTFTTLLATTYGGVTEANLVDKSAVESISGSWTFAGGLTVTTSPIVAGTVAADFGAVTATSYGGIVEGNIVNKTAPETITGAWTFNSNIIVTGTVDGRDIAADGTLLDTTNGWGDHSGAGYLTSEVNNLTAHTQAISTTTSVEAGRGSGGVALTVQDGYGNANVSFNHKQGTPDATGSSARIESPVDAATGSLIFAVGDSTTVSVPVDITTVFEMFEAQVNSTVAFTAEAGLTVTGSPIVAGTVAADFGAITGTSYGGISEANLVNKNAAETIVSKWIFSNDIAFGGAIVEGTYTIPSNLTPELDPADGTIQLWTLTGNSTPTHILVDGESLTLMVLDGTTYIINWPTMKWVGGLAPDLDPAERTVIELWYVGTTLYGALVGVTS